MSAEGRAKRVRAWDHNSLRGAVEMAVAGCQRAAVAETTTPRAKALARNAQAILEQLRLAVVERVD